MLTNSKKVYKITRMRLKLSFIFLFLCFAMPAFADGTSTDTSEVQDVPLLTQFADHLKNIWNDGNIDVMLPIYTWHCPWRYSHEKVKDYNKIPWGFGIGKYLEPTPDRRYGFKIMSFQDSFNKPEPTVWYSWEALWRAGKDFRPSLGFTTGITMRHNYHWIPVPGAAPTVGFDYKSFSMEALYIPGFDVLFTWLAWRF